MHSFRAVLVALLLIATTGIGPSKDYPPQNHGGADLIIVDRDIIWGEHSGIGRFVVQSGAMALVPPYYPDRPGSGRLDIHAREIVIEGTIDAEGRGYTGGGGGLGGGALGSPGHYQGKPGKNGTPLYTGYLGPGGAPYDWRDGDGPFPGQWATKYGDVFHGGYAGFFANDDDTTDTSVLMGSGGAGASGAGSVGVGPDCSTTPRGGSGGTGGGSGGGAVRLFALESLKVSGKIDTAGSPGGGGGYGGVGFIHRSNPCVYDGADGGNGGNGGGGSSGGGGLGAGGGMLLLCWKPGGMEVTGWLHARSAHWRLSQSLGYKSGGTIKIFHRGDQPTSGTLQAGRVYYRNLDVEPLDELQGWVMSEAPEPPATAAEERRVAAAWREE